LFEKTVIALVDGELWDLERPLEKSCKLELLDFNHPEGKRCPNTRRRRSRRRRKGMALLIVI
jgi:hypothetical protein